LLIAVALVARIAPADATFDRIMTAGTPHLAKSRTENHTPVWTVSIGLQSLTVN
jgi:hypothetical protein